MGKFTILIIIFGLITLLFLLVIFLVNNLLLRKRKVDFQFSSIIKYTKERIELLEQISIFIKENLKDETNFLNNINKTNTSLKKITDSSKDSLKEIKNSNKILQKFIALIEIYPILNKNDLYNTLIKDAKINEERIVYAAESYDKEVKIYNDYKQTKINSIISKLFKIKDYEYYNK